MTSDFNFTYSNLEIDLMINDEVLWSSLVTKCKPEKKFEKLMKSLSHAANDYLSDFAPDYHFFVSCHLCPSVEIQQLNKEYRNIDKDTDVLSFPLFEGMEDILRQPKSIPIELGDIFISLDKAYSQSLELEVDLYSEVIHLFVHGFFHLLGFDHELGPEQEKLMEKCERELIEKLSHIYSTI